MQREEAARDCGEWGLLTQRHKDAETQRKTRINNMDIQDGQDKKSEGILTSDKEDIHDQEKAMAFIVCI